MGTEILVADDDAAIQDIVQSSLSSYDITTVETGDAVLAHLSSGAIDPQLLILDVMMPTLDGFSTLEEIRQSEEFASLPVLMLTSRGREDDVLRALELDATDFVTKPFKPHELRIRVERILSSR